MIATLLIFTLMLNACSKNGNNPATTNSPEPAATSAPAGNNSEESNDPFAEHLEITWIGFNWGGAMIDPNNPTKKVIEEKFNVTIISPPVDIHNIEQYNLYLAEGKSADYMFYPWEKKKLIADGVFRELDPDEMRSKMPNWFKVLESMIPEEVWKARSQIDGKFYYVPTSSYNSFTTFVAGVRKDWMDNVGVSEFPKTMEEYHDLLRKFTFEDPDKNGKNDTYGTSGIGGYMYGAYGLGVSDNKDLSPIMLTIKEKYTQEPSLNNIRKC